MMAFPVDIQGIEGYISFIEEITGITVPDVDYRNLMETIEKKASSKGCTRREYLSILRNDAVERDNFLNCITIGETYFFREWKHFRVLKDAVFPEFRERASRVFFWSATCATGEEAYSLALFASEFLGLPFIVYATDINGDSLFRMKERRFGPNSFREDGRAYHGIVLHNAVLENKTIVIAQEIEKKIVPFRINLFSDALDELPANIDIIFFRNTLIYMKPEAKLKVIDRLVKRLRQGGYLFLGSSETPLVEHGELELRETDGVYYFIRTARVS